MKDTFAHRNSDINLKWSNWEPSNNFDNNTDLVFGKKSAQDPEDTINRVAESMESIVDQLMTCKISASTLQHPKSEDEIFGEMIIELIAKIPESGEKYLLKLRVQQDNVQILYSTPLLGVQMFHLPLK